MEVAHVGSADPDEGVRLEVPEAVEAGLAGQVSQDHSQDQGREGKPVQIFGAKQKEPENHSTRLNDSSA